MHLAIWCHRACYHNSGFYEIRIFQQLMYTSFVFQFSKIVSRYNWRKQMKSHFLFWYNLEKNCSSKGFQHPLPIAYLYLNIHSFRSNQFPEIFMIIHLFSTHNFPGIARGVNIFLDLFNYLLPGLFVVLISGAALVTLRAWCLMEIFPYLTLLNISSVII